MRGPHCIRRNATVLSFQQLEDDSSPCTSAGTSSVASCAKGAPFPFFGYATSKGPAEGGLASLLSFPSDPRYEECAMQQLPTGFLGQRVLC